MKFTIDQEGWLSSAQHLLSPNHDARPAGTSINLLVIHNISLPPDQFDGPWITDFFLNKLDPKVHPYFETIYDRQVSAHLLIRRDGSVIQFVPFELRAWHAGVSSFQGVENCNNYSIGIELEGSDFQPFTDIQYEVLTQIAKTIQQRYPAITLDRITGHSDIASGRKTDPGPFFAWERLKRSL